MPGTLNRLDAFVLARGHAVNSTPVTFGWNGKDYTGTTGARNTMTEYAPGGVYNDQDFSILVATAQFGEDARPTERATFTVSVDADGIPCAADEAVGARITARIVSIGRAGGGLTYTLKTEQRG